MSLLDRPVTVAVFKPPTLKRSAPPRNLSGAGPRQGVPLQAGAPLGAAPVGLSPGLGPSNPAFLVMHQPVTGTPMSIPIVRDAPAAISADSIKSRMYSREEWLSLRGECCHTPSAILDWVLGMYRTDGVGGLRVPPHLRLLVDEMEADRTDLLGGASRKNARPTRVVRAVHHKVMSILSRLTPQKYDVLKEELFQLPLKQLSDSELRDVVKVFFNKSVQEHKFSDLYARLVSDICQMSEADNALDKSTRERLLQIRMRSELLSACQDEFNRPLQLTQKDRVDPITGDPISETEIQHKRDTLKARLVGNIKFVGELYKYSLVNPRVVSNIFSAFMADYDPANPTAKEDYLFEVFGMLLRTVGARLCRDDPQVIETVMGTVHIIQQSHTGNRVRFAMMDLCDLQSRAWQISKVLTHSEHEKAEAEKAARDSATLDRQKASLRTTASSGNLSSSVSHMDPNKVTPVANKGARPNSMLSSSTSTPLAGVRSFPGATTTTSIPNSPLTAGKKQPTTTTTTTTTNNRMPTTPLSAAVAAPGTPMSRSSATSSPIQRNGEHYQDISSRLSNDFNDVSLRPRVLQALNGYERQPCIMILTCWIREAVINTSSFRHRENLPHLFYSILERCEDQNSMILSSSDLLTTVLEWIRIDVEQKRFNHCPRMFANWGGVVASAFRIAASTDQIKYRPQWTRVLSVLSCSTFTLSLREIVTHEYRDAIVTAIRDMSSSAQQITSHSDIMAGREPQKILNFAALCRFRLLPYVIKADEGDKIRVPHTPSLGPTAHPIGSPPSESYHQCFQIQQDDAELQVFKCVVRRSATVSDTVSHAISSIPREKHVSRLVTLMKITAATLSLLNPPTREKPLISEADAAGLLREAISLFPSDLASIAQAAVIMEMICFYCCNTNKVLGLGNGTPFLGASVPSTPNKLPRDEAAVAIGATTETFRRWCDANVVDRSVVLGALQSVAPTTVPNTPGTPPRMSSSALDAMDNSFSLPEPSQAHRSSITTLGGPSGSTPATPQMGASRSFRFDMGEMVVRNVNFVSSIAWTSVLQQLQKVQ